MNSDNCKWWLKNVLEYLTVGWYFKKEFKENLQLQKKRYVTRYWKLMRWNLNGVTGLSFQIFINHPHTSILTIQTSTNLSKLFWRKNTNSKPQTFVLIFSFFMQIATRNLFLKFWSLMKLLTNALITKIPHFPFYKINFVFSTLFEHIHYYSGQADTLMKSENITSVMTLQNKIIYHNGDLQKAKLFWDTSVLFPARKLQIYP